VLTPPLIGGAVRLVERLEHRSLGVAPPAEAHEGFTRGELAATGEGIEGGGGAAAFDRPAVVVLGAGRVGRVVIRAVRARGFRCIVVDRDQRALDEIATTGASTLYGDAASPAILRRAGLGEARLLVVAIGDALTARLAVERARAINPRLTVISRARGHTEAAVLQGLGVSRLADPEIEAAIELARASLARMGVSGPEQTAVTVGLRRRYYGDPPRETGGPPPSDA
jgi:CPA2 family monovalent cation:H+ antiporter-2